MTNSPAGHASAVAHGLVDAPVETDDDADDPADTHAVDSIDRGDTTTTPSHA